MPDASSPPARSPAIQPNEMLTIGLPAAYWDFLMWAARSAAAPHEQSDPVIRALAGQFKAHVDRTEAAQTKAASNAEPEPAPISPSPLGRRKRAA